MNDYTREVAKRIGEQNRVFATLYGEGRFEEMVERFYTSDAVVIAPEQPLVRGAANISALFRKYSENFARVRIDPVLTAADEQGSLAYQIANATLFERETNNEAPVRFVTIFRREPDGWRCALDFFAFGHLSAGETQP